MASRSWHFLLPGAGGRHEVRAENLGTQAQAVFVDGQRQATTLARVFSGPGGCLLELRREERGRWRLLVDGLAVEDYEEGRRASGDESLRELRGKPDGSYLISTDFDAANLREHLNVIRVFRFAAKGALHELQLSHHDCIWQVLFDGRLVERKVHRLQDNAAGVALELEVEPSLRLPASLAMKWLSLAGCWRYGCLVNGVEVLPCWSKATGDVVPLPGVPEVLPEAANGDGRERPEAAAAAAEQAGSASGTEEEPSGPSVLPQGVSYDALGGGYQATVRSAAGRFVFLGEFPTPEEAHARYLEALPAYAPGKLLAPEP